jgi:hypothetical protein
LLPQTLPPKEKNQTVHTEPFMGWMQLLFPNFSPGLIPLLKNRDTYLHNDLDCMILHNLDSCSFSSIPKVIWPLWKFIIGEIWLVAFQKKLKWYIKFLMIFWINHGLPQFLFFLLRWAFLISPSQKKANQEHIFTPIDKYWKQWGPGSTSTSMLCWPRLSWQGHCV